MKRCINCGGKAKDEDKFSRQCGERLPEKEEETISMETNLGSDDEPEREHPVKIKSPGDIETEENG